MNGLLQPKRAPGKGLLSRKPLEDVWAEVAELLNRPAVRACDIPIGLTVTSLTPLAVTEKSTGQTARANRATVVMRLAGQPGERLTFRQPHPWQLNQSEIFGMITLVGDSVTSSGEQTIPAARVREAIFASAAFPVAWDAVPLGYCLGADLAERASRSRGESLSAPPHCSRFRATTQVREGIFVDGGVFANQPIEVGVALDSAELGRSRTDLRAADRADEIRRAALKDSLLKIVERSDAANAACKRDAGLRRAAIQEAIEQQTTDSSNARSSTLPPTCGPQTLPGNLTQRLRDADSRQTRIVERFILATLMSDARTKQSLGGVDVGEAPKAPSSSLARLAGGLMTTAAEIELSTFYGRRITSQRSTDKQDGVSIRLFASSRAQRLASEPIHHFGGFLARTFREHDFFAGVADVLSSWIDSFPCQDLADGSAIKCRRAVSELLLSDSSFISLPCYGSDVVSVRIRPSFEVPAGASTVCPGAPTERGALTEDLKKLIAYRALAETLADLDTLPPLCPFTMSAGITCDGNPVGMGVEWAQRLGVRSVHRIDRIKEAFGFMNTGCQSSDVLGRFASDTAACIFALYGARVIDTVGQELTTRLAYLEKRNDGPMRVLAQGAAYFWRLPTRSHGWGVRTGTSIVPKTGPFLWRFALALIPSTLDLYTPRIGGMRSYQDPKSAAPWSLRTAYPSIGWRYAVSASNPNIKDWQQGPGLQFVLPMEIGFIRPRGSERDPVLTEGWAGFGLASLTAGGRAARELLIQRCVAGTVPAKRGCTHQTAVTIGWRPLGGLMRIGVRSGILRNRPDGVALSFGFGDFLGVARETARIF